MVYNLVGAHNEIWFIVIQLLLVGILCGQQGEMRLVGVEFMCSLAFCVHSGSKFVLPFTDGQLCKGWGKQKQVWIGQELWTQPGNRRTDRWDYRPTDRRTGGQTDRLTH